MFMLVRWWCMYCRTKERQKKKILEKPAKLVSQIFFSSLFSASLNRTKGKQKKKKIMCVNHITMILFIKKNPIFASIFAAEYAFYFFWRRSLVTFIRFTWHLLFLNSTCDSYIADHFHLATNANIYRSSISKNINHQSLSNPWMVNNRIVNCSIFLMCVQYAF